MKALLLSALLVLVASAAQAVPHVTVTSSEVIQADPLRVKTTFDIDLVGPGGWCWFSLIERGWIPPASGDTTKVFGGTAPAGWTTSGAVDHRVYFFPANNDCFGEGAHFTGFSVVTNRTAPCFYIVFETPVFESYVIDGCLTADGPTPARLTTWGALKSTYR